MLKTNGKTGVEKYALPHDHRSLLAQTPSGLQPFQP